MKADHANISLSGGVREDKQERTACSFVVNTMWRKVVSLRSLRANSFHIKKLQIHSKLHTYQKQHEQLIVGAPA